MRDKPAKPMSRMRTDVNVLSQDSLMAAAVYQHDWESVLFDLVQNGSSPISQPRIPSRRVFTELQATACEIDALLAIAACLSADRYPHETPARFAELARDAFTRELSIRRKTKEQIVADQEAIELAREKTFGRDAA